jgi:hypothetical protein
VGSADLWVHEGTVAISFMEPLFTGAVQVTTILLRTGEAAHSRNSIFTTAEGEDFMPRHRSPANVSVGIDINDAWRFSRGGSQAEHSGLRRGLWGHPACLQRRAHN